MFNALANTQARTHSSAESRSSAAGGVDSHGDAASGRPYSQQFNGPRPPWPWPSLAERAEIAERAAAMEVKDLLLSFDGSSNELGRASRRQLEAWVGTWIEHEPDRLVVMAATAADAGASRRLRLQDLRRLLRTLDVPLANVKYTEMLVHPPAELMGAAPEGKAAAADQSAEALDCIWLKSLPVGEDEAPISSVASCFKRRGKNGSGKRSQASADKSVN